MKKIVIAGFWAFSLLVGEAFAGELADAVSAIEKVRGMTERGVTYNDYRGALPDLAAAINRYGRSTASDEELVKAMRLIKLDYEMAEMMWGDYLLQKQIALAQGLDNSASEIENKIRANIPRQWKRASEEFGELLHMIKGKNLLE